MIIVLDVERSAVWTPRLATPTLFLKPRLSCAIIGEHSEQLNEGNAFTVGLARGFLCHRYVSNLINDLARIVVTSQ